MALIEGQDWGWRLDRRVTDPTLRQVFQSIQRYLSNKDEEVTYDIRDLNSAVATAQQAAQDADAAAANAMTAAQDALDAANDASGDAGVALSAAQAAQTAASNAEQTAQDAASAAADALLAAAAAEGSAQQAEATATTAMTAAQDAEGSAQDALDAAGDALSAAQAASSAASQASQAAADAQSAAAAAQAAADAAQGRADDAWDYADDVDGRVDQFMIDWADDVLPFLLQMHQDISDLDDELDDILPITETKIADDAISTPKLQAGSITAGKIGAGEVVAGKLAADSVVANNIAANAVTADKIAANAVTAGKIAADAVAANSLAAMNIGVGKYLRSTEYQEGSEGWSIDSDGSAEFNDVTVRGTVTGSDIVGSTITGGKFQTAETGPRVVMDADDTSRGIRFPSGHSDELTPAVVSAHTGIVDGDERVTLRLSAGDFGSSSANWDEATLDLGATLTEFGPQYEANLAGDQLGLHGSNMVNVSAGQAGSLGASQLNLTTHASQSSEVYIAAGSPVGDVKVHAGGTGVLQLSSLAGRIELDAPEVLVNGQPIGAGGAASSVFAASGAVAFNVNNNTYQNFGPHDGTITLIDDDFERGHIVLPGYGIRMEPGIYTVSGAFHMRTHANVKTTLVIQWSDQATHHPVNTIPLESAANQNQRVSFGPFPFEVTSQNLSWMVRARHISEDGAQHQMGISSIFIQRVK